MKKNLQEAEYREIERLDIRGQLLENQGTPEDRGDGKPFLMHMLRVMIGPYQKEIPITNQEFTKIMNADLQENKKMTLKEIIKEELEKVLDEINMPFDVIEKIKNLDDNIERMMAKRDAMAIKHGEKARYAGMVDEAVDPDIGPQTDEEKDKALKRQGARDGRSGAKRKKYTGKNAQEKYDAGYKQGKATKPRYA